MKKIVAFFIVFCFMASTVSAELVYLKNLEIVDVRIIKENKDSIEVSDGSKIYEILKADIKKVVGREISGIYLPALTVETLDQRISSLEYEIKQMKDMSALGGFVFGLAIVTLGVLYFTGK